MDIKTKLLLPILIGLTSLVTVQAQSDVNLIESVELKAKAQQAPASNIYIVQLKGDPVLAYEGDIKGLKATKPGKGTKINPNSAHVKKYVAHLEAQQNMKIQSVGGDKVYSYRYAFNGFAARMNEADAELLKGNANVLKVWKDEIGQLQTDNSPT